MSDALSLPYPNPAWVKPGEHVFNTPLQPHDELAFNLWLRDNKVPFDPGAQTSDYDMRGFWKALNAGDPAATTSINQNDNRIHFPDYWKTPYHQSFSADSQWANDLAPKWNAEDQLVSPNGTVVFDEKASRAGR